MIVGFTTTYAVSAYHHWCEFESRSGWGVQHYVIKFLWPATGRWFSHGSLVSSTNKTDRHNITEILLKVALSTNKQTKHKNAHNWLYFSVEHSSLWTFVNSSFSCTQKAAGLPTPIYHYQTDLQVLSKKLGRQNWWIFFIFRPYLFLLKSKHSVCMIKNVYSRIELLFYRLYFYPITFLLYTEL